MATIHIIDWLGSAQERSIGISLMRLSHQGVDTQFGLGVSPRRSLLASGRATSFADSYRFLTESCEPATRCARLVPDRSRKGFAWPESSRAVSPVCRPGPSGRSWPSAWRPSAQRSTKSLPRRKTMRSSPSAALAFERVFAISAPGFHRLAYP